MKNINIVLLTLLALQPSWSHAAHGHRTATLDAVQLESSTRAGYENIMYVSQSSTAWIGPVTCDVGWAYFNAADNPYFAAMVMSARLHNTPLRVYVDDSLQKVGGYCQVINLSL